MLFRSAEISLAENCDADHQQRKAKAYAPKEPMHDVTSDEKKPGNKEAVSVSMREKDKKLSASELNEKRGLWDNIHAKRARIKAGSGERMRKPGSEGAPTAADLRNSQNEETIGEEYGLYRKGGSVGEKNDHPVHGKLISKHATPEEAKKEAKAYNKTLSPGEKKYYHMKYHVKPLKEEKIGRAHV